MNHRSEVVFRDANSSPEWGSAYTVTATPKGARVSAVATAQSYIDVDAGHSFSVGDKFLRNPGTDNEFSGTVTVVTATRVTFAETYSAAVGDVLVNLGPDTGSSAPNYDAIDTEIYSDADGTTVITNSVVTASSKGAFDYWHRSGGGYWELIKDSSGAPQGVVEGWGGTPGVEYATDYGSDYEAVQAAVLAIESMGGGTVKLADVTYTMANGDAIALASNNPVTIEGVGSASIIDGSVTNTSLAIIMITGDNTNLKNFKILGNRTESNDCRCINVSASDYVNISGIEIYDSGDHGIWFGDASTNFDVGNCKIDTVKYSGVYVRQASWGKIHDNYVESCCIQDALDSPGNVMAGICVIGHSSSDTTHIKISDNVVKDTHTAGIRVEGQPGQTYNCAVHGNILSGRGASSTHGEGLPVVASFVTIHDNVITDMWGDGIFASAVAGGTYESVSIKGNNIRDCSRAASNFHFGIEMQIVYGATARNWSITDNTVSGSLHNRAVGVRTTDSGGTATFTADTTAVVSNVIVANNIDWGSVSTPCVKIYDGWFHKVHQFGNVSNDNTVHGIIRNKTQEITLANDATFTESTGNFLPINSILLGVSAEVTETISGTATPTTWELGDGNDPNRFIHTGNALTIGTRASGIYHFHVNQVRNAAQPGPAQDFNDEIRVTLNQIPSAAGKIRVTLWYFYAPFGSE